MRWQAVVMLAAATLYTTAVRADLVVYQNGRVREGVIIAEDDQSVRLKQDIDGMMATIVIPKADILKIEHRPVKPHAEQPAGAAPKTDLPETNATASTTTAASATADAPVGHGKFFSAWLQMAHLVPSHLPTLTDDQKQLFDQALEAHQKTDTQAEFKTLLELAKSPNVPLETLNSASYDAVHMSFSKWLAESRWTLLQNAKIRVGKFKLDDVQPIEKTWLSQEFKAATPAALLPLDTYMRDVTKPFNEGRKAQVAALAGINVSNCLEIKEKAMWAQAVLDGQLQITPDLTDDDKKLLKGRIGDTSKVIYECLKYENKARAALNAPQKH